MKLEKIEHKHTLTNILKVALFSLFLMLPFINIASRCLYTICNKNAKDSYYGETINEKQYNTISNFNELEENQQYIYESHFVELTTNLNSIIVINDFDLIYSNFSYDIPTNVVGFRTTYYDGISYTILRLDDNTDFRGINNSNYTISFNFTYITNTFENVTLTSRFNGSITKIEYNKYSYLDNAFEYSLNNLENETWFNWTKNTPIYSGVNSMTTGLGINNNVISMIITYWLILTTIYIIIDIVINLYTLITHIISGRKAT